MQIFCLSKYKIFFFNKLLHIRHQYISTKCECKFILIPKNASSNLKKILINLESSFPPPYTQEQVHSNEHLINFKKIIFYFYYLRYFKKTIVIIRNPKERLISGYLQRGYAEKYTFKFFLQNLIKKNYFFDDHLLPQHYYLPIFKRKVTTIKLDNVIKLKNLVKIPKKIFDNNINLKNPHDTKHLSVNINLTPELDALIKKTFEKDWNIYNRAL